MQYHNNMTGLKSVFRRRDVILKTLSGAAAVGAFRSLGPFVRDVEAATLRLRWMGDQRYNVESLTKKFEAATGAKVTFLHAESGAAAYSVLKDRGTDRYDVVLGSGWWPRQMAKEGMLQLISHRVLPNTPGLFADFEPSTLDTFKGLNAEKTNK